MTWPTDTTKQATESLASPLPKGFAPFFTRAYNKMFV